MPSSRRAGIVRAVTCYTAGMPPRLLHVVALLYILTASGCAALDGALAVARPVVGAVCLADGFAPVDATDPRVIDALIALAAAGKAPPGDVAAQATLAARVAALPR